MPVVNHVPERPDTDLEEITVVKLHELYGSGALTAQDVVSFYLDRIDHLDRGSGGINSYISVNPNAMSEAARLDKLHASGRRGQLHGVPIVLKDQIDVKGLPTTLGSLLFKDHYPDQDALITSKLRQAGAIILGKSTLGELGGGDTHGTLFGSTLNPYDRTRTAGGSSGGSAAAVSANLTLAGIGQEGFASIRRPAAWTCVVGMRPTPGLVSRSGVFAGWPGRHGAVGPITRSVADLAPILDSIVGYDPEDPLTAHGVGHSPPTYTAFIGRESLRGVRIGVLREAMGYRSEPESRDFAQVDDVFCAAIDEMDKAGAILVDPITIPDLVPLINKRSGGDSSEAFSVYMNRNARPIYKTFQDVKAHPLFSSIRPDRANRRRPSGLQAQLEARNARDQLMTNLLSVMADHQLDVVVHKSVEHQPTRITEGTHPPYTSSKGATHLNTFLIYASSISVPAGFTSEGLPTGITFLGRPYAESVLLKMAHAYEQIANHRIPPL